MCRGSGRGHGLGLLWDEAEGGQPLWGLVLTPRPSSSGFVRPSSNLSGKQKLIFPSFSSSFLFLSFFPM